MITLAFGLNKERNLNRQLTPLLSISFLGNYLTAEIFNTKRRGPGLLKTAKIMIDTFFATCLDRTISLGDFFYLEERRNEEAFV